MKLHVHCQSKTCSNKKSQNADQSVALLSVRLFSRQVAGKFNLCGKSINICTTLSPRNIPNKSHLNVAQCLSVVHKHCHTTWGCTETCIQYSLPPFLLSPQKTPTLPTVPCGLNNLHPQLQTCYPQCTDLSNKYSEKPLTCETNGEKPIQKHNSE